MPRINIYISDEDLETIDRKARYFKIKRSKLLTTMGTLYTPERVEELTRQRNHRPEATYPTTPPEAELP